MCVLFILKNYYAAILAWAVQRSLESLWFKLCFCWIQCFEHRIQSGPWSGIWLPFSKRLTFTGKGITVKFTRNKYFIQRFLFNLDNSNNMSKERKVECVSYIIVTLSLHYIRAKRMLIWNYEATQPFDMKLLIFLKSENAKWKSETLYLIYEYTLTKRRLNLNFWKDKN